MRQIHTIYIVAVARIVHFPRAQEERPALWSNKPDQTRTDRKEAMEWRTDVGHEMTWVKWKWSDERERSEGEGEREHSGQLVIYVPHFGIGQDSKTVISWFFQKNPSVDFRRCLWQPSGICAMWSEMGFRLKGRLAHVNPQKKIIIYTRTNVI